MIEPTPEGKQPRPAPSYALLYPELCAIVRPLGYVLALHGSMVNDLDLVAIPWTDEAVDPEQVVEKIKSYMDGYTGWDSHPGLAVAHGRMRWLIWFKGVDIPIGGRACIDLSIMPRQLTECVE